MRMPKTILVPTDFSSCSQQAVQYAVRLAKKLDARVYLMHAWTMPYWQWDEQSDRPHDVPPQLSAAAKAALDTTLRNAQSELPDVEALFYVGDPTASILVAAIDVDADLIIVGTHGRSGFSRFIEGSVAETVTRRSRCPVLAIRYQSEELTASAASKDSRSSAAR